MNTIYKYPIVITDSQTLTLPSRSVVTHVGLDPQGTPCIWAKVDTDSPPELFEIIVAGTGHPLPDDILHLGSFVHLERLVWHVFQKRHPLQLKTL